MVGVQDDPRRYRRNLTVTLVHGLDCVGVRLCFIHKSAPAGVHNDGMWQRAFIDHEETITGTGIDHRRTPPGIIHQRNLGVETHTNAYCITQVSFLCRRPRSTDGALLVLCPHLCVPSKPSRNKEYSSLCANAYQVLLPAIDKGTNNHSIIDN